MRCRTAASRRWRARGLTLLELMLVIAIIGMLSAVIGVAVFHHFRAAQVQTATIACGRLRNGVQIHAIARPADDECPTPARLKELGELDASTSTDDPWGTAYRITCEPEETIASSAGPDHAFGTDDDIRVPVPPRAAGVATRR